MQPVSETTMGYDNPPPPPLDGSFFGMLGGSRCKDQANRVTMDAALP